MTNEEKAQVLQELLDYLCCKPGCKAPEYLKMWEAMNGAMASLRTTHSDIPLTLEQLREMEGEPVWVERNENPHDGKWFIVDYADTENSDKTLYTKEGVTYSDYGKYFTAYAYPPARLDLDTWEPCKLCGKLGEEDPCYKDGCFKKNAPACDFRCDKFLDWRADRKKIKEARFCPACGRPLTEEARAELEKRLRG